MIKIAFADADIEALRYGRFHHPDPRVQVRLEALYLRSQGVANAEIQRLCGISKASFHRYLTIYASGGIEALKRIEHYRPHSELYSHRPTLEAAFAQDPPATVAEAAARIATLTGIERKRTNGQRLTVLDLWRTLPAEKFADVADVLYLGSGR